ncbi:MAG: hypothetical protein ACRC20_06705 [Segniliparus sp.]|uniref:hypothetical protein n=1 Tax=Segniliparus sp. TaxID=2804064 RepID=UPI003F2C730E
MIARSSLSAALALLTAGFMVAGCERGGARTPGASGSSSASVSATSSVDPAVAAQKAACAAFRDGVASSNTANQTFLHAVNDPKHEGDQYDKPITDAANAAAVIFMYVSDQIEGAVTPQVPKDLARKLMDFVQILQERANLYAQHKGGVELNVSADKYTPAVDELLKECPSGSSDAAPPKLTPASASSPDQAKQAFCGVFNKNIQQTEDGITRFGAATRGDENHPNTQWDDADQWLTGQAQDTGIIFKYASNAIEAQVVSPLSPDLEGKGKALVAAMRRLGSLYADQKSTDSMKQAIHEPGGYGESAEAVDNACKAS